MKEKLALFVVTHKEINIKNYPGRKILYVGNGDFKVDNSKTFRDNTGINISNKNPIFCELTALYWIWKNYKNAEYVGIEHYRRCYYKGVKIAPLDYLYKKSKSVDMLHFKKYHHFLLSTKKFWTIHEGKYLFPFLRKTLCFTHPDYIKDFDRCMKRHSATYCNMFICKREIFNKFMKFIFDVLFYAEKKLKTLPKSSRPRSLGFMAERLLDTFILHNKLSEYECKVRKTKRYLIKK